MKSRSYFLGIRAAGVVTAALASSVWAGNTWDGGGADSNWNTGNNWNPDGTPGYGTATFAGSTKTTPVLNVNYNMNQVDFTGTSAWTLNSSGGSVLSLFDFGGTQAKIENHSTGLLTINVPITFAANNGSPPNPFGEINAINADITFGTGTLTVSGSSVNGIKMFSTGNTVTYNNTVNATGKWFGLVGNNKTMAVGGAFTSGDIYVMNGGTLKLNSGGSLTTSAVRLGGDFGNTGNQNQTLGGTFQLTNLSGGQSFSGTINAVSGNTSNALLVDSLNTSGTNTLSGGVFLDSDLKIQQSTGGTLDIGSGGSFDVKARKLTFSGGGTVFVNRAITSSLTTGGSLVKEGAGILSLISTANNYTGTNAGSLNAAGTTLNAGTIRIYGDGSLGLAPTTAYNNINFTGNAILRDHVNNITLHANRNINISSGVTATFNSSSNTFTINGIINGTGGNVISTGTSGKTIFAGNNSYTGTTQVTGGTLLINGTQSGSGAVTVNASTTLGGTGSFEGTVNVSGILAPGSSIESLGSGAVNFLAGSTFAYELNSAALNGDLVDSTGVLDITGTVTLTLAQAASGTLANNSKLTLISYMGGWTSGELFTYNGTPLDDDSTFTLGANQWMFNYNDSTGGSNFSADQSGATSFVTMTVIPEPASAMLGLLGSVALLRRRRR